MAIKWKPVIDAVIAETLKIGILPVSEGVALVRSKFGDVTPDAAPDARIMNYIRGTEFIAPDGTNMTIDVKKVHPQTGQTVSALEMGWFVLINSQSKPAATSPQVAVAASPATASSVELKKWQPPTELGELVPPIEIWRKYKPRVVARGPQGAIHDTDILEQAIMNGQNILIIGPPGGGKSSVFRALSAKMKLPYYRAPGHGQAEVSDLVGQWIPSEGGKFEWQDGPLTQMVRKGGIYVQDEVNALPPELTFKVHGLLDAERSLVLTEHKGEVIPANPGFVFAGTMNEETEGVREMNEAFRDRFDFILYYDYDTILEKKIMPEGYAQLLDAVKKLRGMKSEIITPVSTRALKQFVANRQLHGLEIAKLTFINKFKPDERQAVKRVIDLITE